MVQGMGNASQVQSASKDEDGGYRRMGAGTTLSSRVEETSHGGGKRSLVKNTRVTRSFTRRDLVACCSQRGCFMAQHSLVIEYFAEEETRRPTLLFVASVSRYSLSYAKRDDTRTCSMFYHRFYKEISGESVYFPM